jgi:uncharacterized protein
MANAMTAPLLTVRDLRAAAVARSLFAPTDLADAVERLGFVQADPIRAPARAQDLTLRHRALDYRAGDLERRYAELGIEEDHFVNYGYLPRRVVAWMHPRSPRRTWSPKAARRAALLLDFVKERGSVHPRDVDEHFAFGTVTNYWGGSSNATTHLLDAMHYRGLLRVLRRDSGIRVYAPSSSDLFAVSAETKQARADALLALAFTLYAPLPVPSLGQLASRIRRAAPQLARHLTVSLKHARAASPRATLDGVEWVWPEGEDPRRLAEEGRGERVRFLAPFDPVVWDRRRFELFWGWAYRFEAYTPVKKRKRGYYALPLLWRDQVIGWGNLALVGSDLDVEMGYVAGRPPRDRAFKLELEAEVDRVRSFLGSGTLLGAGNEGGTGRVGQAAEARRRRA